MVERIIRWTDRVVPPTPSVVLHSSPDLDDSVVALLRAAPADLNLTLLAEDAPAARRRARALGVDVNVVARRSVRGLWRYWRAAVAVCTHGLFGSHARGRTKQVVGLWHGEFGKLIGPFVDEPPRHFDWVPVSSELSRSLRSAEFALHPQHIHVVGSPRQLLLEAPTDATARVPGAGPHLVWAPTYRTSVTGLIRTDGDPGSLERELALDDAALLDCLHRYGATLWFRPHPAASEDVPTFDPAVRRATNADLEEWGLTFYELLAVADGFVTDYSSLWVDYLLCDGPMIAFCPDLEDYRRNRGLALEPHEQWFPGPVVGTRADLLAALEGLLDGVDPDASRRTSVRSLLHTVADADPAAATWSHVRSVLAPGEDAAL